MANTLVIADAFVIVPEADFLVLASGDEVLTRLSDCKSINLAGFRSIKHSDGLTVIAVPIGNLSIAAGG